MPIIIMPFPIPRERGQEAFRDILRIYGMRFQLQGLPKARQLCTKFKLAFYIAVFNLAAGADDGIVCQLVKRDFKYVMTSAFKVGFTCSAGYISVVLK